VDSFDIGISGLGAAQKGFDIIGNNIANAATDGYHRQRLNLVPAYAAQVGSVLIGGGVEVADISRMVNTLLENEIIRQQSSYGQVSKEVDMLRTIETAFGEISNEGGLNEAIDEFFNALRDLASNPNQMVWQNQVLTAAEAMANRFRALDEFLANLENQITLEAEQTIVEINNLINTIAELNDNI
jgi:flagellar hook-associated protein 1 FlgK